MKKLWMVVGIVVVMGAFALTGCGAGSGETSVEPAQSMMSSSGAEETSTPAQTGSDSSEKEPAPTADEKATVTLQDDKNGTAVQKVAEGNFVAEITVPFTYEKKDGKTVIAALGEPTARNVFGWVHVEWTAAIDQDKTTYVKDRQKAAVGVIYEASIGSGNHTYDDSIEFDLSML